MTPETSTRRFRSRSPEATEELGAALGRALVRSGATDAVLALDGELGAGKTTLVRGLGRGLGAEGEVTSPSFTLMHEHPGEVPLWHLDAWMAGRERALLEGGAVEALLAGGVAAIEWGGRVADLLPEPRLEALMTHVAEGEREVLLQVVGQPDGAAAARLEAALEALEPVPDLLEVDG